MRVARQVALVLSVLAAAAHARGNSAGGHGHSSSGRGSSSSSSSSAVQLPNTFLQIGDTRTATTMQFMTICAAASIKFLLNDPEATVRCGMIYDEFVTDIVDRAPNDVYVVKAHKFTKSDVKHAMQLRDSNNTAWLFETTRGSLSGKQRWMANLTGAGPAKAIVSTTEVADDGYHAGQAKYEAAFGLSAEESGMLYEWLESWDVLRVCCGAQMSQSWREHVVGGYVKAAGRGFGPPSNASVELCLSKNISEVEESLINSKLFQALGDRMPTLIGRPSNVDGPLTGSYCETCLENTRLHKLKFNDMCNLTAEQYISRKSYQWHK
eukprot:INCI6545.1.p1 GENE.INCI6545.1~~INCI6545.1.p1  ORF type:complete len:323 (+),score=58.31 INCI6545.1:183-1151(+)